jgi:hypothetical protein
MEESDRLLLELAQRSKGLEPMLDAVFSFLKRKTDLYVEQGQGDSVGFPPGQARKIVLRCFDKFASAGGPAPDKKALETIGTRLQGDGGTGSAHARGAALTQLSTQKPSATQAATSQSKPTPNQGSVPVTTSSPPPSSFATASLPHYNGAALETYAWSQTLNDVTISIPLPPPCSAKSLTVKIEKARLSVQRRDGSASTVVLQGDLPHDVDASESLWNLDGNILVARVARSARAFFFAATTFHMFYQLKAWLAAGQCVIFL